MKTCLSTLVLCLAASTAVAQFVQPPEADRAAADKDKNLAADKAQDKDAAARAGGPAGRRGPAGPVAQGAVRGPMGAMSNLLFEAIDVDGDGMITKRELSRAAAQFKKLDTDGDGNISLAEVAPQGMAMGPAMAGGQFGDPNQMIASLMQNDKNGDGKLTADEIPGPMAQQMIQNGDKDGDGALSREELAQAMQGMQNGAGNWPGGPQGGQGNFPGGQGAFQGRGMGAGERQMMGQWMQWDRNGDGMLGANEVPRQAAGMLRGGDLNNDGMISPAELKMLIERNGERMRNVRGQGQNELNNADKDNKDGKAEADGKKRDRRSSRET
jgi:Ca2+-binding EF-hand superfamily protein